MNKQLTNPRKGFASIFGQCLALFRTSFQCVMPRANRDFFVVLVFEKFVETVAF